MFSHFRPLIYKKPPSNAGIYCTLEELQNEARKAQGHTLHLRRDSRAHRPGGQRSSVRRRGMEFFESRPYVAQDEMRTIDWKVSARLNNLFTKIFIEEKDRPIYIALDFRAHMFFGTKNYFKSVLAAKIAARLAQAAINGGDPVGAFILNEEGMASCRAGVRSRDLARLLGLVAEHTQNQAKLSPLLSSFWPESLSRLYYQVSSGSVLFLISDFEGLAESAYPCLHRLRKRSDVFALNIYDPIERELPNVGFAGMSYGDIISHFDSSEKKLQDGYRKAALLAEEKRAQQFRALDIPELGFSTADNLDENLKKLFSGHW